MKNIKKHITESNYAKAYLLYGEERFLVRAYKKMLRNGMCPDDDMNYAYYEGKDVDINDIRDNASTLPFFADRKLIMIENSGMFKSSSEAMVEIIKESPETTFFVFVESEVDKRNRMYKTVSDLGYVCEMKSQTEEELGRWAYKIFYNAQLQITTNDMKYLVGVAGPDMDNIYNEAEKLISYCRGRGVVTKEDIDELCSVKVVDRVFDLINAMSSKNADEVLKLYGDLLALKEPPLKLLAIIGKQFSQLLAVKKLIENGVGNSEIAQRLGIRPFFIGRYVSQAKQYTMKQLDEAVRDCVEAEYSIKAGKAEDKYAVELLILKYSM